jgi:hypothetical protein
MTNIEKISFCIKYNYLEEFKTLCNELLTKSCYMDHYSWDDLEHAMDYACFYRRTEMIIFLGSKKIKPSLGVMDLVCKSNNLEIVKLLHRIGGVCTTNAIDWASENGNLEMVKFLVSIDASYNNVIQLASMNGHTKIIEYLDSL